LATTAVNRSPLVCGIATPPPAPAATPAEWGSATSLPLVLGSHQSTNWLGGLRSCTGLAMVVAGRPCDGEHGAGAGWALAASGWPLLSGAACVAAAVLVWGFSQSTDTAVCLPPMCRRKNLGPLLHDLVRATVGLLQGWRLAAFPHVHHLRICELAGWLCGASFCPCLAGMGSADHRAWRMSSTGSSWLVASCEGRVRDAPDHLGSSFPPVLPGGHFQG
jgi:hypothetical protein